MNELDLKCLNDLLQKEYGNEVADQILINFHKNILTTLRVNTLKSNKEEVIDFLNKKQISFTLYPQIDNAFIINSETNLSNFSIYQEGKIYLQSLSSMLPPFVLNPLSNDHILDMAAAPGGKTSLIASLTHNEACITAVETNALRAERLKYNLDKLGVKRTTVLVKDARELDEFFRFDKVLLDAPCSGSGTISLNEDSKQRINQDIVMKCQKRQIALLKKGLSLLKKGGILIYSTCSIFKEENEEVIKKVINKDYELLPVSFNGYEHLTLLPSLENTQTIMPNEYFEGFFVAMIRKK